MRINLVLSQYDGNGNLVPVTIATGPGSSGSVLSVASDGSIHLAAAGSIAAAATTSALGAVIVPVAGNLAVDGSGNISVPLAAAAVLGVVKVPTAGHLSIDGSGNISVALGYAAAFGVIKVDNTSITASAGVISASGAYSPATPGNWASPAPTTIAAALDRLAAATPGA